ncbi:PQQ-dependent sugar dehydrogenase [Actinoplanes sp. CA-142083]|uniref:PQQ-dependent sugar dehydrogenase n=1 Tax=Actinoplanes sp. CA-142083 TaxID=3239903 RepID=UPI003D8D91D5
MIRRFAVLAAATLVLASMEAPAAAATPSFDFTRPDVVATGTEVPWGLTFLPDGSALVAERMSARILRLRPGASPETVATVPGVAPSGEGGLLGLAVSPTYAQDSYVYAYFTAATDNRIVRFRLSAPQTVEPVLTSLAKASIHNGGRIEFGPDGMLYAGVGDAGNTANAQNQQSLNGKILRMRPDGGVPPDNPFAGSLVYSLGHRNVQGLAWDAQGRLFATEFGQNTWDEVNQIVAGGNYGWPIVEGNGTDPRFRNPIVQWSTAEASPSGAAIVGDTLYAAALRGTRLWQVPIDGGTPTAQLTGSYGRLRTVEQGPDGWLWITTSNRDGRGTPAANDDRVIRFPRTGTTTPGAACAVRYELNQWSTGFTAAVTVTNTGPAVSSWALTWTFAGNQRIGNAWNATYSQSGQAVTVRNASWNGSVAANGTVTFGFQAGYSGTNAAPTDFRLNGVNCSTS